MPKDNGTYLIDEKFVMMFAIVQSTPNQTSLLIEEQEKKFRFYIRTMNMDSASIEKGIDAFKIETFELERCNPKIIPKDAANYVLTPVNTYLCVPSGFSKPLFGSFGGNGIWMRIQLDICKNSTKNGNSCFPADTIYRNLSANVFNLHYVIQDTVLNGYNFD